MPALATTGEETPVKKVPVAEPDMASTSLVVVAVIPPSKPVVEVAIPSLEVVHVVEMESRPTAALVKVTRVFQVDVKTCSVTQIAPVELGVILASTATEVSELVVSEALTSEAAVTVAVRKTVLVSVV